MIQKNRKKKREKEKINRRSYINLHKKTKKDIITNLLRKYYKNITISIDFFCEI